MTRASAPRALSMSVLVSCATSCARFESEVDDEAEEAEEQRAQAYVLDGEDAAIGAFRFAEQHGAHYHNQISTETVLDIAKELDANLSARVPDYAPPKDVTHCGSADATKRSKPCSAGKLWKRAEEMRKEDMHDAAGADLLRALLKTGIEVDFVEKCERSLQWAFGSVRRQRERERREAIEEAKLEKRREEEREAMREAEERKKEYEAYFVTFGQGLQESLAEGRSEATINADGTTAGEENASSTVIKSVVQTFIAAGPQGGQWDETLQLIRKIPPSDKTVDVLLIEARCHEMEGHNQKALSVAGRLIAKAGSHGSLSNASPAMLAATLGANAAMQLGLSDTAISFYQSILKFDPEQDRARTQYRGLKKVTKLLKKAEDEIQKGYNKKASDYVDDCLSAMRGLDVDSPLFRSKIQLKQCTIMSGMGKHEEALENCDTAVELRLANEAVVSAESRKEAHLVRGEALLLDMDYDDAVADFRSALDLVPEDRDHAEEYRELQHKLQQAQHQQQLWNGGHKDQRYNEHTGFPDGRPPERDHEKILQLPIDLAHRTRDVKCAWLKKQFKTLVRKFHPDKYKGNKKRGSRKFKEVKEAKEIIGKAWNC